MQPRLATKHLAPCLLAIGLLLCGCATFNETGLQGILYTHTRVPFSPDLDNTPMPDQEAHGKIIRIKEPFSGYGVYTEMNSNAIGDIAQENGLSEIYFADLEIFSILGIWTHNTLYIYGKMSPDNNKEEKE